MRTGIIVLVMLVGCTAKVREERKNHEAIILHNSMVTKAGYIEHRLNELKKDTTVSQDSLTIFAALLKQWRKDLVEVPGNDQHDHEGHAHDHTPPLNITNDEMLDVQKELDLRLSLIGKRISELKPDDVESHEH